MLCSEFKFCLNFTDLKKRIQWINNLPIRWWDWIYSCFGKWERRVKSGKLPTNNKLFAQTLAEKKIIVVNPITFLLHSEFKNDEEENIREAPWIFNYDNRRLPTQYQILSSVIDWWYFRYNLFSQSCSKAFTKIFASKHDE